MAEKKTSGTARQWRPNSLSADQRRHYEQLQELRNEYANQIETLSAASLSANPQAGEELADIGSDNFIRETELALMDEETHRLELIEAAIGRIREGGYGICIDCGEKIPDARLDAKPYASLCVQCKGAREQQAGFLPRR